MYTMDLHPALGDRLDDFLTTKFNKLLLEGAELEYAMLIHATWLVSMFNHLSSSEGRISIAKGWKKAGISEVIDGKELPPEDPFEDL